MLSFKTQKIIYWSLTILLMVPAAGGGLIELFTDGPEQVAKTLVFLGYPLYLMKILGFAKVLGGMAIIYGKFPKLKEWAYAGFTFDFIGAIASHVLAHDSVNAVAPAIFLIVLMISYKLWNMIQDNPKTRIAD